MASSERASLRRARTRSVVQFRPTLPDPLHVQLNRTAAVASASDDVTCPQRCYTMKNCAKRSSLAQPTSVADVVLSVGAVMERFCSYRLRTVGICTEPADYIYCSDRMIAV
eukprot:3830269-Rhodomonas_salina.2